MQIDELREFFSSQFEYLSMHLDIIEDDLLQRCVCDFKIFYNQISDIEIEVTLDSGHGHNIVLLFTESEMPNKVYMTIERITYFGDCLNIVKLRKVGFYDDQTLATRNNISKKQSYEYFQKHAKRYVNPLQLKIKMPVCPSGDIKMPACLLDDVEADISAVINAGVKQLLKKGMSKEVLVNKNRHKQKIQQNRDVYKIVNVSSIENTIVRKEICKAIDAEHKELISVQFNTAEIKNELYTNPYTHKSFTRIVITDRVTTNSDRRLENHVVVEHGFRFNYAISFDSDTEEILLDSKVQAHISVELEQLPCELITNEKYISQSTFYYNARDEIIDMCSCFMKRYTDYIDAKNVGMLVKAFIKSIDHANNVIAEFRKLQ